MKRFLHFILFYVLMVSSWADSNGDEGNKFGLCKICGCNFIANEYNVTCTQSVQYDLIFHDEFWIVNGTNETMAYNSVIINNNNFIHFNKVIPKSNLTYLNLAYNSIFNISDSIFRNLQNMRVLILSHNDLEIIHPDTFRGLYLEERLMPLRNLKELRLDYNKIHTLSQDIFEHTTEIEILDVSNNPFEVIDQHTLLAINNLMLLKELYLQYTQIKTLPDNMLHTPKFLRILDLSGNHELEILPETLSQARNLEKLFLNNTGFVNLTKENGFPDMPSLKVLHLCRNEHLHHIDRFALGGLTNLTDLRMSDNIDLTSIADLAFAKQSNISGGAIYPPIKKLYLGNNKLSYLESEIIARWDSLSELDIAENPWTCECENQWLIDDLMPIYLKIDEVMAKRVMCAAPIEMKSFSFYDIYMKKSHMRCLDLYGNRPEEDGTMLVGILAVVERNKESRSELDVINEEYRTIVFILILLGVLIAIPAILFLIFAYQKRWFSFIGMIDKSPASYSRRFYSASSTEDF